MKWVINNNGSGLNNYTIKSVVRFLKIASLPAGCIDLEPTTKVYYGIYVPRWIRCGVAPACVFPRVRMPYSKNQGHPIIIEDRTQALLLVLAHEIRHHMQLLWGNPFREDDAELWAVRKVEQWQRKTTIRLTIDTNIK